MNVDDLLKDWNSEVMYRFDINLLQSKGLNENTVNFLSIVGLPTSAAPFLGFADSEVYWELQSVYSTFETKESEHQYLLNIGSNGAGDPICIDLRNDCQIVVLDHDNKFKLSFMNSSVLELFQFLTIYDKFGKELIITNGEDAFLNANFTDKQFEELKTALKKVDEKALDVNAFWMQELEVLLANREYFSAQK